MSKLYKMIIAALLIIALLPIPQAGAAELTTQQKFEVLKKQGIFTGFSDGSAGLDAAMSREQFAAVLFRLWELKKETVKPMYADVLKTRWSIGEIHAVSKAGLMAGTGNGMFSPAANVTIEQLAVVLVRGYGLTGIGQSKVTGKVSSWAKNAVSLALDHKFIPSRSDYTVKALRSLLVEAAYAVHLEMNPMPFTIDSVQPISGSTVQVNLHEAATVVDKDLFAIKDASGNVLAIQKADLGTGGKVVTLTTAGQTAYAKYTLTYGGKSWAFVGLPEDRTKPRVVSVVVNADASVDITFSEPVKADSAANPANYQISGNLAISKVIHAADKTKVTLITGTQQPGTLYTLTVRNIADLSGNVMDSRSDLYFGGTVDKTKPTVKSIVNQPNEGIKITFSEKVNAAQATKTSNYTINNGLAITRATLAADGFTVTLLTGVQKEGTVYTLTVGNIADLAGNVMDRRGDLVFGGIFDRTPPAVTSVFTNPDATVTVKFNEKVNGQQAANISHYTVSGGLTVSKAVLEADGQTVTLTILQQQSGTVYTLAVFDIADLAGNVMSPRTDLVFGGMVDRTPPEVIRLQAGVRKLVLTFSEKLDPSTAQNFANYTFEGLGYASSVAYNDDDKTVTLTTADQTPGTLYAVVISNVKDKSGNAIAANTRKTFVGTGADTTASIAVQTLSAIDVNTVAVQFDRALSNADVSALRIAIISDNGGTLSTTNWKTFVQRKPGDDKTVTIQFRQAESNPELFKQGHVYSARITGIAGLNTTGDANIKMFAGTNVMNELPYPVSVVPINNTSVKVQFSEPVKNVSKSAFTITDSDGKTVAIRSDQLNDTGKVVTEVNLNLETKLKGGSVYNMSFNAGITDAASWNGLRTTTATGKLILPFAGSDEDNAGPRITRVDAVDRHTFDIYFSEPVNKAEQGPYSLFDETGNTAISITKDSKATYKLSSDRTKVTVYLHVDAVQPLASGRVYRLTYDRAAGQITDVQGKVYDPSAGANEIKFAANDTANAHPSIVRVDATTTSIAITFSEPINGYSNQTTFFDIKVEGADVRPTSGSITGNVITLKMPKQSSGKIGSIRVSTAGIAAIRDLNRQLPSSDWINFGVK